MALWWTGPGEGEGGWTEGRLQVVRWQLANRGRSISQIGEKGGVWGGLGNNSLEWTWDQRSTCRCMGGVRRAG